MLAASCRGQAVGASEDGTDGAVHLATRTAKVQQQGDTGPAARHCRYHTLHLKPGEVIDLVINNQDAYIEHPLHLHGHWFWVMARGAANSGPWDPKTEPLSKTPILRDTVTVNFNSYIVVRFVADNCGTWIFHCEWRRAALRARLGCLATGGGGGGAPMPWPCQQRTHTADACAVHSAHPVRPRLPGCQVRAMPEQLTPSPAPCLAAQATLTGTWRQAWPWCSSMALHN